MRTLSWITGIVALVASGAYLVVYVYRWEWHRALLVGVLFLAGLVGVCTALVLRRLAGLEQRVGTARDRPSPDPLDRLRAAPVDVRPFPWLRPEAFDRTSVFIPILLGGGVLVSGAAWLVERLAGASARSGVEEELARQLRDVAFPAGRLVPTEGEVLAGDGRADDPALRVLLGPSGHGAAG
ncbi:hypothetical protein [Geodermatophilus sp. DSM 44513]|uniref:hypothetical protein n=1 Tax=Geodermatophilus sp. DSM 44513 TaxID=1528104 RepID=UPI0012756099|nr:hypothetical protein [Geodermatophilus sp. DSM 44513]WNV77661.1 hypothetical protein RTG05_10405 [Geodermatophilus sp. DSM 44513]